MNRVLPVLLWDWDGTLIDSISYKYGDIWQRVFPHEKEKQEHVIAYLKTEEGRSKNRYGLIAYALAQTDVPELAQYDDEKLKNDTRIKDAALRYDEAAKQHVQETGLVAGAENTLKQLHEKGHHMYLLSGGGTDADLQEMLEHVGAAKYFSGIYGFGAPGTSLVSFGKAENLERVMESEQDHNPMHYLIIGDSKSDQQFAEANGIRFIGVANEWNKWNKRGTLFSVIEKVSELVDVV